MAEKIAKFTKASQPMEEQEVEEELQEQPQQQMAKKIVPKQSKYNLVKVATQHELMYEDNQGNLLTNEQALLQILNDVAELKKGVLG